MPKCLSIPTENVLLALCQVGRHALATAGLVRGFVRATPSTKPPLSASPKIISLILARAFQYDSTGSKLKCSVLHCGEIGSEKQAAVRMKQSINSARARYSSHRRQQWCRLNDWAFVKLLPLWKQPIIFLVVLWNASITDRTSEWEIIQFIFDCFCSIDTLLYTLSPIVSSTT